MNGRGCSVAQIAAALLLVIGHAPAEPSSGDPCASLIPAHLKEALESSFSGFRAPLATDNLQEDVDYERAHGGDGCLGVARGDFDGDGRLDVLVALTARDGDGSRVVVALARDSTWDLHSLDGSSDGRSRLYVGAHDPGVYVRTEALDGDLEPGERIRIDCPTQVAVFGETEASGVAYCYGKDGWEHVWISD